MTSVAEIRDACEADLPAIRSILEEWMIDPLSGERLPAEVESRVALVAETFNGRTDCEFFVAEVEREGVIGVAGLASFNIASELFSASERPVEVITSYVRHSHRGTGIGRALLDEAETRAQAQAFTTLLVVSGARNRESGYPFWRRRYGEPVRWDEDYFAPGAERVVWRHALGS